MKVAIGLILAMGLMVWLGSQTAHLVSEVGRHIVQAIDGVTK